MTRQIHEGRCLCGAVWFQAGGPPKWTALCHCASCRKHTGAPVSAFAGFESEMVRFFGTPMAAYASSAGVVRGFCGECGSTLTYSGDRWPTEIHFHVGAFDHPEAFAPTSEAFPEEALGWLRLGDSPH